MDKFNNNQPLSERRSPWISFLILMVMVFAGLFIGQFLGLLFILPLFDFDIYKTESLLENLFSNPQFKLPVMIFQGSAAICAFIVAPLVYLYFIEKKSLKIFFNNRNILLIPLVLTVIIVIAFMAVNSVFIDWNANLTLPDFLQPFEEWALQKELMARELTEFLTDFENPGQFLMGIIVIALIPAIGEELLFRGLIQNQFYHITKNIHLAIWIAGFLFSLFHFQFYGLIPRMLLGVLFGYLYYWSANLMVPMLAHFVNNGFTLSMFYLYQIKKIEYDIENVDSIPLGTVVFSLVLCTAILIFFRKFFAKRVTGYE